MAAITRILVYLVSLTFVAWGAGAARRLFHGLADPLLGSFPWPTLASAFKLASFSTLPIALILASQKASKFTLAGKLGSSLCGLAYGTLAPVKYWQLQGHLPPGATYTPMTLVDIIVPPALGFGIVWTAMELSDALPGWQERLKKRGPPRVRREERRIVDLD